MKIGAKFVLSAGTFGAYRLPSIRLVREQLGDDLEIVGGDKPPDKAIRLISKAELPHTSVRTLYVWPGLVVQLVPAIRMFRAQVLVMDLNPRQLHVWVLLVLRRLAGRRTVLWGHAWPRSGRGSRSDRIRGALRNLSDGLIAYTRTQALELGQVTPNKPVWVAANSLYSVSDMKFDDLAGRDSIVYVGRLTEAKKPGILIEAFELLHLRLPWLRLVIVGDGDLFEELVENVSRSSARSCIELLGHISDYETLRTVYSGAIASVSPGYVGLSITQSFGFGVPMVISRNEPHSPEIEAAVEGFNCSYFQTDNAESLADEIAEIVSARRNWASRGPEIARTCADTYSVEAMAQGLVAAIVGR